MQRLRSPDVSDIDAADALGITALTIACSFGHVETARLLLGATASKDLAAITRAHRPLTRASTHGQIEIVRLLLASDVEIALDQALWEASARGYANIARLLIEARPRKHQTASRQMCCQRRGGFVYGSFCSGVSTPQQSSH